MSFFIKQFELVFGSKDASFYWLLALAFLLFVLILFFLAFKFKGEDIQTEVEKLRLVKNRFKVHSDSRKGAKGFDLSDVDVAYQLVGGSQQNSDEEIKEIYREKMAKNHPDKLEGIGLDAEFTDLARERSQQINEAWKTIKQSRGLK